MDTVNYTPMIMQYLEIKKENPGVLIMFRLGDFYEFFFEDAILASKTLQLVLTKKAAGNGQKIPMCGIPYHASASYLQKLVSAGHKVGIVEQLEDPALAKGLVERGIVQIVTPGAVIDFDETHNNFIVAIDETLVDYAICFADVSTGDISVIRLDKSSSSLANFISNLGSKEIVVGTMFDPKLLKKLQQVYNVVVSFEDDNNLRNQYQELFVHVKDTGLMRVAARLINYLVKIERRELGYFKLINVSKPSDYLQIDAFSRVNLELTRTIRSEDKFGSLFWLLDNTKTAMGRRLLKNYINQPLCELAKIYRRQLIIDALTVNFITREEVKASLEDIYDFERIIARISFGNANPKELLRLKASLRAFEDIRAKIIKLDNPELTQLVERAFDSFALIELLEKAISEDAPLVIANGDVFNFGYDKDLDQLIKISKNSRQFILDLEEQEKAKTGIKNLKIGYNRVFGYYIEVTNSQLELVKDEYGYIRKQTTKNGERYINETLKDKEAQILSAEERRGELEKHLYQELLSEIKKYTRKIQAIADIVAELDVMVSLTGVSIDHNFKKPTFNQSRTILVKAGRHPVVDTVLKKNKYVANDIIMDHKVDILLITGPNMGGKSTYMRQLALIIVLAQMGCFVPAESANLMVFDQIFTRIGASDDLVSGQSTFMVEMSEANVALRNSTENSLLIFDEIGRGTATYDGMALAQAMIEYVASNIKAKTVFSTHYHELTFLDTQIENLKNIHVEVKENKDDITFLYKVKEGPMNKSYGINVATLADLPYPIIKRAKEVLAQLETSEHLNVRAHIDKPVQALDKVLIDELKAIDPNRLTPLQALDALVKIKQRMEQDE
ncbi:MAG TPA: DNA mismatch repair protein MutS [Bacilli bacterium]|nr:DNA mismatch repair protein MutS [Bacilli bacterium]